MNAPTRRDSAEGDSPTVPPTDAMFALMYAELKAIAERVLGPRQSIHSLNPTALVHEAYVKLAQGQGYDWAGHPHFLGVAAKAIRHILVDHARRRNAAKGSGGKIHVEITDEAVPVVGSTPDLVELDDALVRLASAMPNGERLAHVVELRYFGGVSIEHTAQLLGVSVTTVKDDWAVARAWLRAHLAGDFGDESNKRPDRG